MAVLVPAGTNAFRYSPKSHLEVEVGDVLQSAFYPQIKIKSWGNDANLSFRLNLPNGGKETVTTADGSTKIIWQRGDYSAVFYHVADGEGAFEFEIRLGKRPPSNSFSFSYNSKNVVFYYQPALTPQEASSHTRPENVVGSYAVYHASQHGNEYGTGKLCHIFRPHARDAAGAETWGTIAISQPDANGSGTVTLSLPQAWLNSAVYPVIVDPTFGYNTIGLSNQNAAGNYAYILKATAPANGDVDSIDVYCQSNWASQYSQVKMVAILHSTLNLLTNGVSPMLGISGLTPGWKSRTYTSKPSITSGTVYDFGFIADPANATVTFYYDTGSSGDSAYDSTNDYGTPANLGSVTNESKRYSIRINYTATASTYEVSATLALSQGMTDARTLDIFVAAAMALSKSVADSRAVDVPASVALALSHALEDSRTLDLHPAANLALSHAMAGSTLLDAMSAVALGLSPGVSGIPTADMDSAAALALQAGVSDSHTADVQSAAAMDLFHGLSGSAQMDVHLAALLGLSPGAAVSTTLDANASASLALSQGVTDANHGDFVAAAALGVLPGFSPASQAAFESATSLGTIAALTAIGGGDFTHDATLGLSPGMSAAQTLTVERAATLAGLWGITAAAQASLETAAALGVSVGQVHQVENVIASAIALACVAGTTSDRTVTADRTAAIAISQALVTAAAGELGGAATLGLQPGAAAAYALTVDRAAVLGLQPGATVAAQLDAAAAILAALSVQVQPGLGNVLLETISLGLSTGVSAASQAALEAIAALATAQGITGVSQADLGAAVALALTQALDAAIYGQSFQDSFTLALSAGIVGARSLDAAAVAALGLSSGLTGASQMDALAGALLALVVSTQSSLGGAFSESVTLSLAGSLAAAAQQIHATVAVLGLIPGLSAVSQADWGAAVSLALEQAMLAPQAGLEFSRVFSLALLANLSAAAGSSFDQSAGLSLVAGLSGSTQMDATLAMLVGLRVGYSGTSQLIVNGMISLAMAQGIVAGSDMGVFIASLLRTMAISVEPRLLTVQPQDRTLIVPLEERGLEA